MNLSALVLTVRKMRMTHTPSDFPIRIAGEPCAACLTALDSGMHETETWYAHEAVLSPGHAQAAAERLLATGDINHACTDRFDGQVVLQVFHFGPRLLESQAAVLHDIAWSGSYMLQIQAGHQNWPGYVSTPADASASNATGPKSHIMLSPGSGWGDGYHPTTQAAAQLVQACELSGRSVLDIGWGWATECARLAGGQCT